jgi:carbon-monoxide dehydrogenase large subunit
VSSRVDAPPVGGWIGRAVPRREDVRFLRGEATYVDDVELPGMLHAAFVRSSSAHARLLAVDAEAARGAPGVVAVLTGADVSGRVGEPPLTPAEGAAVARLPHPVLATDAVRYAGQAVAAVVAESRALAEDAAELVAVELEPLPVVVTPAAALAAETPLHEAAPDNVLVRWTCGEGDVAGAFAAADHVARVRVKVPRLVAVPMETRGAVAEYDAGTDVLTVWCSAQDPHRQLAGLAPMLRRPEDRIRFVVPDVGGAFGSKGVVAPETAVVGLLALELRRPVKWIEDRFENFVASYQGRGLEAEAELALAADGRMLGLRARLVADLGAYLYPTTVVPPVTAGKLLTGVYTIPAAFVEVLGVATNKVPTGPYRGAGRPEAALVIERLVDVAAGELGADPVSLRRRNLIPPDAFPYRTPLGFTYDSGDYPGALDRALALFDHDAARAEQARARADGRLVGVGLAFYVERVGPGWESAAVAVTADARVIVRTGSTPHGQGHETTFAQIAADALGVDPESVVVVWGDSHRVPRGTGTFASRSVAVGGSALVVALERVLAQARAVAARLLEADPADIGFAAGVFESGERTVPLREVAAAAYGPRIPAGAEPGLEATARFSLPGPAFSSGVYAAVVEIDRETGEAAVRRLVAVDDAGVIVNPLLAEGQVVGAAAQALGECFLEEAVYDENGQLVTASLADYLVPSAPAMPHVQAAFHTTPSPLNPLGAKGVGEGGAIGTPAAVANAVCDALAPLGVRHVDLPFTPDKLWALVRGAGDGR